MADRTNNTKARVLIADDHQIVAEALRSILEKEYDVVGIVSNGQQLLDAAPSLRPDVVVVDIGMPLLNGLSAAQRLKQVLPDVTLVFLTINDDPNIAAAAMESGAMAYVLKNDATSELLHALHDALRGRPYVSARLRAGDWAEQKARARQVGKGLTFRQEQVLQLLAEGRAMKEIADILGISQKTVEFHKYQIMRAFNLKSNADIVRFALQRNRIG